MTTTDETASLLNTPGTSKMMMMRGSISSGEEEVDADNSYAALVLVSVRHQTRVDQNTRLNRDGVRGFGDGNIALPEAGALGKLKKMSQARVAETFKHVLANARSKRGGEMGINGDGALLVSTSTSVKHSASLGDNTEEERRDSERGESCATTRGAARRRKKEEEEALEELLVGVHDQVYGKKHLIDNNVLNKREGKGLPIFIHIPKAGGTSVEAMVANVGARIEL